MSWLDDQRKRFLGLANTAGRNVRDVFDANTASDQAKRIAAGQPRYYQDQQRQQGNPTVKYGTNLFSQSYNRARDYVDANTAQDRAARLAQGRKEIEQQTFQAKYAPLLRPAKQVFDVATANPIMNPIGFALKATEQAKNVFAPLKSINNFVHGVDEGAKRSLVGTAQSTAGLVDLVSPGEGQSSLTKLLNSTAEGIDQRVKNNGYNNIAYKGGQIATDIGTFFVPGTQASKVGGALEKGVKFIPKGSKSLKGVSEAFNVVSNTLDKGGKVGKNANKVAKFYLKPENAIDIAVDTGMNAGYRSARGEDYSPTAFLQDAGLSTLFGGAIGGATVTAKKIINKIWGDADVAKIAKSTDANEIRDALLMKYPNLNKFELDKMAEDLVNKSSRREVKGALEEAVTNHEPHTAPTSETITSDPNAPEVNKPTTPDVPPTTNPVQPTTQPITQPITQPGAQPVSIKERYPQLNEAEATRLETKLNEAQTPEEKAIVELEAKARNDAVQAEITAATESPVANSNQQAIEADTAVMNDNTANVAAQDAKAPGEPNTKTMQDLQTLGVTLQDLENRQLPPVKENQALNGIISATEDLKKEGIPDAVVERALRDPNAPTDPYAFKNFVRANANRFANDVNTNVVKSEAPIEKTPQPTPDPTAALEQEALKYKSAEEFVRAQGSPLYRGGHTYDQSLVTDRGVSMATSKENAQWFAGGYGPDAAKSGKTIEKLYLKPDSKILNLNDVPKDVLDGFKKLNSGNTTLNEELALVNYARKQGYDAIDLAPWGEAEVRVINKDVIRTKQQLTDLYNQATAPKTEGVAPKSAPVSYAQPNIRAKDIEVGDNLEIRDYGTKVNQYNKEPAKNTTGKVVKIERNKEGESIYGGKISGAATYVPEGQTTLVHLELPNGEIKIVKASEMGRDIWLGKNMDKGFAPEKLTAANKQTTALSEEAVKEIDNIKTTADMFQNGKLNETQKKRIAELQDQAESSALSPQEEIQRIHNMAYRRGDKYTLTEERRLAELQEQINNSQPVEKKSIDMTVDDWVQKGYTKEQAERTVATKQTTKKLNDEYAGKKYNEGRNSEIVSDEDLRTDKSKSGQRIIKSVQGYKEYTDPSGNKQIRLKVNTATVDHTPDSLNNRITELEKQKTFYDGELAPDLEKELQGLYSQKNKTTPIKTEGVAPKSTPIEKTPTMSPEEQSLYNSAPGIKQTDGPAPNIEPTQNIVGDTSEWLTPSSRDNLNEAGIDDAMIKYLQDKGYSKNQIETFGNLLYAPHRVTQPEGLMYHVIGAPENPPVAGFVNNTPNIERAPMPVADSSGSLAPLGKIVESFFDNFKGDVKINYPMLDKLGKRVTQAINDEYKAIGSNFNDVAQKVQAGANQGIKRLEDAGLTPQEADILRRAQAEMNYVRRRASLGKKEVGQGDLGEMYIPRQVEGQYGGDNLFKGFRETKPGNEFSRKAEGIKLENIDNDASVIGEYVTRYGDTKLTQRERIVRAFEKDNPDLDKDIVDKAASEMIKLQDEVNNLKTRITVAGLGKKKILSNGKAIDTAGRMSEIGRGLNKQQITINETPGGLTNGDRINSVEVSSGKTVGDYTGLNQHRDAESFAKRQFKESGGDRQKLAELVRNRLANDYDLPEETVQQISDSIGRMAKNLPPEAVEARVLSSYQMAAKQQLMKNLQNINITNKTLRHDVSELTNQILRSGSIERQASSKIVSAIMSTQNAIFRKLNVSSSINELSDLSAITSVYGKNTKLAPDFKLVDEFGLGDIDPAIEPFIKQIEEGKSVKSVLSKINSATNLYKFVETYKAAVMANSAKAHYSNLKGDALTKQVLKDYRDMVLPVDAFTKTFLDNYPLYTQYMSWGARNLQKEGRLLTGKLDTGILADKTTGARIARNLYANLPAKTVFWLTSNALKGTAILTAFGLTDFTGLTNQDYSGIAEEDKSLFDKTTQLTNQSTTLSLLNNIVQGFEKEQLKNSDKYKNADYNPYEKNDVVKQAIAQRTPQVAKNITGAIRLGKDGYSENSNGKIQFEAPTDVYNKAKSFVFGKNSTTNARLYSGNKNIIDRVKESGTGKTLVAIKDMAAEQVGLKDKNYQRPLSKDYSTAYKEADKSLRKATLDGGREFNSKLDNLKKNDVTAYNNYISAMDGNHVGPEYWREIVGGSAGGSADLKLFNTIKDRKKQLKADMERVGKNKDGKYNYDPIYDLPENKARRVLAEKATATGEDLAIKNILYKEAWYNDYQKKVAEYNKNKVASGADFKQSPRAAEWDAYNKKLISLSAKSDTSVLKDKYPLVYQLQKLGFGTPASKAFLRNNYDAWKEQNDALDQEKLAVINKMRVIEGHDPLSAEAYAQATEVNNPDSEKSKNGYTKYANSGYTKFRSTSDQPTQYKLYLDQLLANDKNAKPISSLKINTRPAKIKMKSFAPKAAKVKRIRIK